MEITAKKRACREVLCESREQQPSRSRPWFRWLRNGFRLTVEVERNPGAAELSGYPTDWWLGVRVVDGCWRSGWRWQRLLLWTQLSSCPRTVFHSQSLRQSFSDGIPSLPLEGWGSWSWSGRQDAQQVELFVLVRGERVGVGEGEDEKCLGSVNRM